MVNIWRESELFDAKSAVESATTFPTPRNALAAATERCSKMLNNYAHRKASIIRAGKRG